MTRTHRSLISDVTTRACATFTDMPVRADNYFAWSKHWFAAADIMADEFKAEGLTHTHQHFIQLIDSMRKVLPL